MSPAPLEPTRRHPAAIALRLFAILFILVGKLVGLLLLLVGIIWSAVPPADDASLGDHIAHEMGVLVIVAGGTIFALTIVVALLWLRAARRRAGSHVPRAVVVPRERPPGT